MSLSQVSPQRLQSITLEVMTHLDSNAVGMLSCSSLGD